MAIPVEQYLAPVFKNIEAARPANDRQPLDPSGDPQFQVECAISQIADLAKLISDRMDNHNIKFGLGDVMDMRGTIRCLERIANTATARIEAASARSVK